MPRRYPYILIRSHVRSHFPESLRRASRCTRNDFFALSRIRFRSSAFLASSFFPIRRWDEDLLIRPLSFFPDIFIKNKRLIKIWCFAFYSPRLYQCGTCLQRRSAITRCAASGAARTFQRPFKRCRIRGLSRPVRYAANDGIICRPTYSEAGFHSCWSGSL